jgi:hypothetical protein
MKVALVGAVVVVAALAIVIAIAWQMAAGTLLGSGGSFTTETEKVRLYISASGPTARKTHFEIPKAYLSNKAERDGGWETGIDIVALFPTFEHYSQANRNEFESKHGRVIAIQAVSRGQTADSLGYDYGRLSAYLRGRQAETTAEGFTIHKIITEDDEQATDRPRTEELVVPVGRVDRIFVCERAFERDEPPFCRAMVDYSESLAIHYLFPRRLLADWQQIEGETLRLVHSFEVD